MLFMADSRSFGALNAYLGDVKRSRLLRLTAEDQQAIETLDGGCNNNEDMFHNVQVQAERGFTVITCPVVSTSH